MKVIYFHTETAQQDFPKAWDAITALQEKGINITRELTSVTDDYSYWAGLNKYWGRSNLSIIEQDIVVRTEKLDSLIRCSCQCCTYYFKCSSLYLPNTLALGCRIADPEFEHLFPADMPNIPEWATFSGVGLVKFSARLQQNPLERFPVKTRANGMRGLNADNAIIQNINSWMRPQGGMLCFHVHGEVEHLHK